LDAEEATFLADSQVPWGIAALEGEIEQPAWRMKPSYYLVATQDHMIPVPAQRSMAERAGSTVIEVASSHAVYVSKPEKVAGLIRRAAQEVSALAR
jgi:pimeloyl-ACP methyl ester carboxylesterase